MPSSTYIRTLATSCAAAIYGHTPPSPRYAQSVADLLAGTAAVESDLRHRRQHGFTWQDRRGAWGLWQTELAPLEDSLAYLLRREDVEQRAAAWLWAQQGSDMIPVLEMTGQSLLQLLSGWDRLACLMARLHYLRFPGPVPSNRLGQARYWKQHYNTRLGAGTVDGYLAAWERHYGAP